MSHPMRPVTVRVERLVLEGFAPSEQAAVVAAVRAALTSAFDGSSPPPASHVPRIDAGTTRLTPGAIGQAVGGSIRRALRVSTPSAE